MAEKKNTLPNNTEKIGVLITVLTIYGILLGHATAASFRAGYLSYFGVSIDAVPFWPKISDFMIAPVIAIVYILIMTLLFFGAVMLGNYLGHKTARLFERKMKDEDKSPLFNNVSRVFAVIVLGASFAVVSLSLPYSVMQGLGGDFAKKTESFTQLTDRETTTLLIYQHDGVGVIKEYNPDTNEFSNSYEVIELTGEKFERVTIERNKDQ